MATKQVNGTIHSDHTVTLKGDPNEDPPLEPGLTFRVTKEDAIQWDFDGVPTGSRVLLTVDGFPPFDPEGEAQLLVKGNLVASRPATDHRASIGGGAVNRLAWEGRYTYTVHLLAENGDVTTLRCVWETGWPAAMGGGEKSGKPGN